MATKRKTKTKPKTQIKREKILQELRDQPAILANYDLDEIAQNFESREHLRRTLLNSLKLTGEDLIDLAENGTVKDGQVFAQLVDEAPELSILLRHAATLVDLASDRLRSALELRDDYKQLLEYSAAQLKKSLS